jgi:hypothetical protein
MVAKTPVLVLSIAAMLLLLAASLTAIISDDGGQPYQFTSLRGETVEVYGGQGLYQYDTVYKAVLFRGFDWANLVVSLPLLAAGVWLYWRGQRRGQLLLAGVFTYLAYAYLIGVMGNTFNRSFLIWTALFSVGLWGLALSLAGMDILSLPKNLAANFPRKGLAVYVIALGLFLPLPYLAEIITAYATGQPPASLGHYTTLELASLELGIMTPLHLAGGVWLWQRKPAGYLIAILLALTAVVMFISLGVGMLLLYVVYHSDSVFEIVVALVMTLIAGGFSLVSFKRVKE